MTSTKEIVAVGSESTLKRLAVEAAFPRCRVACVAVQSAVPEQPIGRAETEAGATHRCTAARTAHPDAWLACGIENGMVSAGDGRWEDVACVAVSVRGEESLRILWSEALAIPIADAAAALAGRGRVTWSPLKDPHIKLCGRPRSDFLATTLLRLFE